MQEDLLKNIKTDFKRVVADSINEAIGEDLNTKKKEFNYNTKNYRIGLVWDLIIENLINKTNKDNIEYHIFPRGPWEFLVMLDKAEGYLYTFIREERLKDLIKDRNRKQPHYQDIFNIINATLEPKSQQMTLPGVDITKFEKDYLEEKLEDLCGSLLNKCPDVKIKHVVITFSFSKSNLTLLKANILNDNLDLVTEESWNDYIVPKYEFNDIDIEENEQDYDENDCGITLKPDALKKRSKENSHNLKQIKENQLEAQNGET